MNATEARELTNKSLNKIDPEPYILHINERIKHAARHGMFCIQDPHVIKYQYAASVFLSLGEKIFIEDHYVKLGYVWNSNAIYTTLSW